MREIKFRAKRISDGTWVYGGIYRTYHPNYDYDGREDCRANCYAICANNKDYFVAQDTIGQFTGLYDRNGKEIYEGDIIATKLKDTVISVGDIQFECGLFGAEWTDTKKHKTMVGGFGQLHNLRRLDDDIITSIEVIGNIHDNPELLKNT